MRGSPPKDPSVRARRNNPTKGFTKLSAELGVVGVPAWPLPPDLSILEEISRAEATAERFSVSSRKADQVKAVQAEQLAESLRVTADRQRDWELSLWAILWGSPQAALWEASPAFERMLAQFTRWNVKAEQGDLKAAVEARARGAEFGLTPRTLMALRAEIERADEAVEKTTARQQRKSKPPVKKDDPRVKFMVS